MDLKMDALGNHDSKKMAYPINGRFDTILEEAETTPILGIKNKGRVNRPLATQKNIGVTSFSAVLNRVQYGSYNSKPACLVAIDFSFSFQSKSACRYNYARIEVELTRAVDANDHRVLSDDPTQDPKVVNIAPKSVYGIVKVVDETKYLDISIPLLFESPIGLSAGITGTGGVERSKHHENRMEVHGNLDWDDDHDEAANAVSWQLTENAAQKDGIFRQFRAATVFLNEPGQPLWMKVIVKPTVKFSADPRRLLPKNDHPVLLDGKTPLLPLDLKCDDFSADTFPWGKVLQLPLEYTVIDSLCKNCIIAYINPRTN
jgi:hypothetical protein